MIFSENVKCKRRTNERQTNTDKQSKQRVSDGSLSKKAHEMPKSCGAISCPHKHCSTHGRIYIERERWEKRAGRGKWDKTVRI